MDVPIALDPSSSVPIYRQIYHRLREAILRGVLGPGRRLESTRELARQLGVSRTTATNAYDQLVSEGYLDARRGAWTFVAHDLPDQRVVRTTTRHDRQSSSGPRLNRVATRRLERERWPERPFEREVSYDFGRPHTPAVDVFPRDEWRRLVVEHWRSATPTSMMNHPHRGHPRLREQIARHIRAARGIECDHDQVIITSGSERSVAALCTMVLRPGATAAIEDPSVTTIQTVLRAHDARLVPVPVDGDGIIVASLATKQRRPPSLVYVTPTHQHPTGVVLTLQRRLQLLHWAAVNRVLIVEDDLDSEFSYEGPALEALQALDTANVVVYLGSFIKVLSPAIRISYMIVPPPLVDAATTAHRVAGRQTETVHQAVLARFMETGGFSRHLRRLRRVHLARRNCLIGALQDEFGDDVVIGPSRSGVHLHVRWRSRAVTPELLDRALAVGVAAMPIQPMYIRRPAVDPGALLAFASLPEHRIKEGVRRLGQIFQTATEATHVDS